MRDLEFDSSREVGIVQIGHRMWDSNMKRKYCRMQDSHKSLRSGNMGSGTSLPDPGKSIIVQCL